MAPYRKGTRRQALPGRILVAAKKPGRSSATSKEIAQQRSRGLLQDLGRNLEPVVESGILRNAAQRAAHAGFRIERREYHALHTREHHSARAHRAWFERHIERGIEKPPIACFLRGRAQC